MRPPTLRVFDYRVVKQYMDQPPTNPGFLRWTSSLAVRLPT